jgi:hypothetical protein
VHAKHVFGGDVPVKQIFGRTGATMEKWEYCTVECRKGQPKGNGLFYTSITDGCHKVGDPGLENAQLVLNHLGSQGWELVDSSVNGHANVSIHAWTLKRPIP